GQVWQVKGVAELMRYSHASNVAIMDSTTFEWHQTVNTKVSAAHAARIGEFAGVEPPSRAINRASVTENCQGWVIRVLRRLVEEGMVEDMAVI
ncbi:hypothetical protein F5144DRAFT_496204, partial [Chaetomium tenue]